MLIIALTGGIGSGKSTVAASFIQLNVPVIDADQLARELVVPGSPALAEIALAFGPEMILKDGKLDRPRLRRLIFADQKQRLRLEAILHPGIYAEMRRRMQTLQGPYCVLVIPLLLETGETAIADRILVVDAPESLQRGRVHTRDGLSDADLDAILNAQFGRAERLRAAADIIVNDGDLAQLKEQVAVLHRRYLDMAASTPAPRDSH
jgi:dephospho-CoA kinase